MQWLFSDKMAELDDDNALTGHSYYSKEMMNFKISYSYSNYLEPVLLQANDMAARNAKPVAAKIFLFAAIISLLSLILFRLDVQLFLFILTVDRNSID